MGKIVEKKKKKGRPSLLDLQKRNLKQQQEQQQLRNNNNNNNNVKKTPNSKITNPSPNSSAGTRRSTRRNPNPKSDDDDDELLPTKKNKKKQLKKRRRSSKLKNDDDDEDDEDEDEDEVVSDEERGNSGSAADDDAATTPGSNPRKRKIDSISPGSGVQETPKSEKHSSAVATTTQATTHQESKPDDGSTTPLPDKSLLIFILDRLQKKDTYGVFADPVDPEELPDYHEVIDNPMDFSTVRKKLANGAYATLEQFEKDVFLICSNAMQYNAPDTIYFRQARSIQELAIRNFDNLRADSDDNEPESEPKVARRGRPPTKNLKRPPGRPPLERANSDYTEATLATAGGSTNRTNNEVKKASHISYGSTDSFARSLYGSRVGEAYLGWSAERYERADDMTGSASKGILMKHGKKQIVLDETRRNTYNSYSSACGQEPSVLTAFDRERKQLIAVGLHTEYGYARSLARFAAKIGPVAWTVATKKIERCIPTAVKFGPGWVGENEAPAERPMKQQSPASVSQQTPSSTLPAPTYTASVPTQGIADSSVDGSAQKRQGEQLSGTHKLCNKSNSNEESSKALSPSAAGNDATSVSTSNVPSSGAGPNLLAPDVSASSPSTVVNILNNGTSSMKPGNPYPINQTTTLPPRINGLNGSYGLNFVAQMGKIIGAGRPAMLNLQSNPSIVTASRTETQSPRPPATDSNGIGESKLLENSTTIKPNDLPNAGSNQKVGSTPPDLNVGFQSPGSPVSGKADSVQPDLALQL